MLGTEKRRAKKNVMDFQPLKSMNSGNSAPNTSKIYSDKVTIDCAESKNGKKKKNLPVNLRDKENKF